jgi:hypothetical protein
MKNLLSENMMRFGTKNLNEAAKKDLVVKSIMETIEQHGLHLEVRKALQEANDPKPNAEIKFTTNKISFKQGPNFEPLVVQSPKSLGDAARILGTMMKLIGSGKGEGDEMINIVKQISSDNYPAILWKVRYSDRFRAATKSRGFETVTDWLKSTGKIDKPFAAGEYQGIPGSGGKGPFGGAIDYLVGTRTGDFINAYLQKFNQAETFES